MLSSRVKCAIEILSLVEEAAIQGVRLTMTEIRSRCGEKGRLTTWTAIELRRKGWMEYKGTKQSLSKVLSEVTLYDLVMDIDDNVAFGWPNLVEGWTEEFKNSSPLAVKIDNQLQEVMDKKLRKIYVSDLFKCRSKNTKNKRKYERTNKV